MAETKRNDNIRLMAIIWNPHVKLILSDVDETVADVYTQATQPMVDELTSLLREGKVIFFVSGGGLNSIHQRVVQQIPMHTRKQILIGHCSGAEVWGYSHDGSLRDQPYYSVYNEILSDDKKKKWRETIQEIITLFNLKTVAPMPVIEFKKHYKEDPLTVMLDDRGPQITLELVNSYDLSPQQIQELSLEVPQTNGAYDLRIPILEKADELFQKYQLPITPKLGGVFALDFVLQGVSKTTAIDKALTNQALLENTGLTTSIIHSAELVEIWGDKFSTIHGGTDRHMCEAVDPQVRAIDFREEDPQEFPEGFHIVVWNGQ
ncbi:MAG TPA: hypothetical protein VFQ63_02665, partial [Patescibacteria group bacterium]|nr:hypothetical protein [Patescibacteria group bacterium]